MDNFDACEFWNWGVGSNGDKSCSGVDDLYDISSQNSVNFNKPPHHMLSAASPTAQARLVWTPSLHKRFVDTVLHLGIQNTTPDSIVKQMNVDGLTCENVAIHLYKYRLYWKRTRPDLPYDDHVQGIEKDQVQPLEPSKPQRMVWDVPLHRAFVEALAQLGIEYATPEKITQLMNVDRLTHEDVVDHLQRYRPYLLGLKKTIVAPAVEQQRNLIPLPRKSRPDREQVQKKENLTVCLQSEGTSHHVSVLEDQVMFYKVLTRNDVGTLDFFIVPKEHAEDNFPALVNKNTLLINFAEFTGKIWQFKYSYWKGISCYVLYEGWISFVQEKELSVGDVVCFRRRIGDNSREKFFIHWSHRSHAASLLDPTEFSHGFHPSKRARPFDDVVAENALLYCFIFPPDYEFEKDTLLQLWMAAGIFVKEPIEEYAALFFEDCLTKGYFQLGRFNLETCKVKYKFKSDKHLLQSLISRGNHIQVEGTLYWKDISPEVSHVSIRCCNSKDSAALHGFARINQLRTLVFLQGHQLSFKQVPRDFFLSLSLLQVLDFSHTCLTELPSSIGNMKSLRYLNLSKTSIRNLPETIGCLKNLQTLKLRGCSNLFTLPKGIRRLINLRHLDFDVLRQLNAMPRGMGALINIRTLPAYLVGFEEECSISQLKYMINLSGSFCISRLENVLTEDEAAESCLCYKSQITRLELHWTDSQYENAVGYEKVISSLQPYTGLEELCISGYGGLELPCWISDRAFSKLVSITLFECENCLVLPSLGKLPSLKVLNIINFHKLKVIDHNFYGGLSISRYIAFPKLEKLTLENMLSLEEWTGVRSSDFPQLLNLTVKNCPKLYSFCTLSCLCSLEKLEISHCAVLDSCPNGRLPARVEMFIIEDCPLVSARLLNNGGHDWLKVAHVPHIWIDHQETSFGQRTYITGKCRRNFTRSKSC